MIIFLTCMQRHYRKLAWAAHMSYIMLSLQNMYLFRDIFTIFQKGHFFFIVKLNFGDSYRENIVKCLWIQNDYKGVQNYYRQLSLETGLSEFHVQALLLNLTVYHDNR